MRKKRINISKKDFEKLYKNYPMSNLVNFFSVSKRTILNYVERFGIPKRPIGKRTPEGEKRLREKTSGKNHYRWKGCKNHEGYVLIKKKNHPYAQKNGYISEHRLVMENHIGRYLKPEEVVHHKGIRFPMNSIENRSDNRIENLKLFKNENEHQKYHWKMKKLNKTGK